MDGSFRFRYTNPGYSDEISIVEWDQERKCWVRFWKSHTTWREEDNHGALNQAACDEILSQFGLSDLKAELPMETVQIMSPEALKKYRK